MNDLDSHEIPNLHPSDPDRTTIDIKDLFLLNLEIERLYKILSTLQLANHTQKTASETLRIQLQNQIQTQAAKIAEGTKTAEKYQKIIKDLDEQLDELTELQKSRIEELEMRCMGL